MKRIAVLLLTMMVGGLARAGDWNDGLLGGWGGQKLWQSTNTILTDTLNRIATGHIIVGYVQVLSSGTNSNIKFQEWGTTVALKNTHEWSVWGATSSTFNTNYATQDKGIYVHLISSTGWVYTSTGLPPANIRILWDYLYPPQE